MQLKWQLIQDGTSEKAQWVLKRVISLLSGIAKTTAWAEQGDWDPQKEPKRTSGDEDTLPELKNEIASLRDRVDQMEKRISDAEDKNLEINQKEEKRNWRMKNNEREVQELADDIRRENIRILGIIKGEKKEQGLESIFGQIVDENFPNLRTVSYTHLTLPTIYSV